MSINGVLLIKGIERWIDILCLYVIVFVPIAKNKFSCDMKLDYEKKVNYHKELVYNSKHSISNNLKSTNIVCDSFIPFGCAECTRHKNIKLCYTNCYLCKNGENNKCDKRHKACELVSVLLSLSKTFGNLYNLDSFNLNFNCSDFIPYMDNKKGD